MLWASATACWSMVVNLSKRMMGCPDMKSLLPIWGWHWGIQARLPLGGQRRAMAAEPLALGAQLADFARAIGDLGIAKARIIINSLAERAHHPRPFDLRQPPDEFE